MKQVSQNYKTGKIALEEVSVPTLKSGGLLVRMHHELDLVHTLSEGPRRDLILVQELYTLAARREPYRALCVRWMRRSRALLETHFSPDTARRLDALIEGLTLHRALDDDPPDRSLTREAVGRISGED